MNEELDPTEVLGHLPATWNAVPAGTLFGFKNGLNYSASQTGTGRGIKVVGVGDFENRFRFRPENDLSRVEIPEGVDKSYLLEPNDLLFVRSNGNKELVGRVMFLDRVDEPVSHSGFTIRGRVTAAGIVPLFAAYFFSSALVKRQFLRLGGGTNISNLSQDILKAVVFPRPSMPEQHKIAAILSTWDHAIELTEKLIAAKQQRKAALMQQLLTGKVRLTGFGDAHWRACELGDVASNSARRNATGEPPPVYSVTNSVGMVPMDEAVVGANIDRYKAVAKYDFAYNPMRINVGSIAMWDGNGDVLVSPDYVVFRCGPDLDPEFLNHYRRSHPWEQFVTRGGGGSVRVRIYFSDLAELPLKLPPIEEQKAIAGVLNTQEREIKLLQKKLDALRRQKKGLMQQLLTGRVRVRLDGPPGG